MRSRRLVRHGYELGHEEERDFELLIERWPRLVTARGPIDHDRPILVVEDDDDVRGFLVEALQTDGFETIEANDGRKALRVATETPPQAVVLDLGLPKLSGDAFVHRWRRDGGRSGAIPVVVVSGRDDARAVAAKIGADAVVGKPVAVDMLTRVLHQLTDFPAA